MPPRPIRAPCVAGVYVRESLGSLIYDAKRNRRCRWTMIYRPRINCGYLRLPEVVTPYMRTARGRNRGTSEAQEGREGLEKSGGIHSYDRRRQRRRRRLCIFTYVPVHTYGGVGRGRFINFWDSRWNPEALKRSADLSPDPSHAAAFAEPLFLLSLFFFFFDTTLSFSFFLRATHPPET